MATVVDFPNSRNVLWDRTTVTGIQILKAGDVIPPLLISALSVRTLLDELSSTDTTIERKVIAESKNNLNKETNSQISLKSVVGSHNSVFRVDGNPFDSTLNQMHMESCLTIPISPRPLTDFELAFQKDASMKLVINLGKAIRAGKTTSLRSCMRIRAAGSVQRHNTSLNGTLRFEAILPNISFEIQQIQSITTLATPLSIKLARRLSDSQPGGPPQVGYVTLNQTRKVVPLLETDPAISFVPIVGVWTALNERILDDDKRGSRNSDSRNSDSRFKAIAPHTVSNIHNPLTWAICTRFLYNEHIKDRACVCLDTFLLVNFGEDCVQCFEVKRLPIRAVYTQNSSSSIRDHHAQQHQQYPLSSPQEFLFLDFTIDLDVSTDDRGSPSPTSIAAPVICKFRPLTTVENIRALRTGVADNRYYNGGNIDENEEVHLIPSMQQRRQQHSDTDGNVVAHSLTTMQRQQYKQQHRSKTSITTREEERCTCPSHICQNTAPSPKNESFNSLNFTNRSHTSLESGDDHESKTPLPREDIPTPTASPVEAPIFSSDPVFSSRNQLHVTQAKRSSYSPEIYVQQAYEKQSCQRPQHQDTLILNPHYDQKEESKQQHLKTVHNKSISDSAKVENNETSAIISVSRKTENSGDIIELQQKKIDNLQVQVDELKALVISMRGTCSHMLPGFLAVQGSANASQHHHQNHYQQSLPTSKIEIATSQSRFLSSIPNGSISGSIYLPQPVESKNIQQFSLQSGGSVSRSFNFSQPIGSDSSDRGRFSMIGSQSLSLKPSRKKEMIALLSKSQTLEKNFTFDEQQKRENDLSVPLCRSQALDQCLSKEKQQSYHQTPQQNQEQNEKETEQDNIEIKQPVFQNPNPETLQSLNKNSLKCFETKMHDSFSDDIEGDRGNSKLVSGQSMKKKNIFSSRLQQQSSLPIQLRLSNKNIHQEVPYKDYQDDSTCISGNIISEQSFSYLKSDLNATMDFSALESEVK